MADLGLAGAIAPDGRRQGLDFLANYDRWVGQGVSKADVSTALAAWLGFILKRHMTLRWSLEFLVTISTNMALLRS